jgi:enhancer of polycomb-like protein
MNERRDAGTQCNEDQFEEVMHFFEETAQMKQPYASVDNTPVPSYADMEECFDSALGSFALRFAKDIYEHWKSRRIKAGNRPLQATLKVC